jgi:hypothetical protein
MQMGGPPAPPPETPNLSAIPRSPQGPGGGSPAGRMEAIPKLVFMVDQLLDTLARAVPGASEEIDQAKATIRGVLAKALQGGPGGNPGSAPAPTSQMAMGGGAPNGPIPR